MVNFYPTDLEWATLVWTKLTTKASSKTQGFQQQVILACLFQKSRSQHENNIPKVFQYPDLGYFKTSDPLLIFGPPKTNLYGTKSFVFEFNGRPYSYFWALTTAFKSFLARRWQDTAQLLNYEWDIWRNWKNIHLSKILNQPVILTLLSLVNTATIPCHIISVVHSQVSSTKVCQNLTSLLYFSLTICNVRIRI